MNIIINYAVALAAGQAQAKILTADVAGRISNQAISNVNRGSKTGIIYKRKGKRFHQASAPGQSPASDTGDLVATIRPEKITDFHWRVMVAIYYAAALEWGTSTMAARPFVRPAAIQVANKMGLKYNMHDTG